MGSAGQEAQHRSKAAAAAAAVSTFLEGGKGGRGGLYWNSGGGQHTESSCVSSILSPMAFPLLRMLVCVRQAALGSLVVLDSF